MTNEQIREKQIFAWNKALERAATIAKKQTNPDDSAPTEDWYVAWKTCAALICEMILKQKI